MAIIELQGASMTSIATTVSATSVLPGVFHAHGHHKKGGAVDSSTDSTGTTSSQGQASTEGLFKSLLQTLEQITGIPVTALTGTSASPNSSTAAVAATTAATSTTATAAAADATGKIQNFLHSLFQALKTDGLGGGASTTAAATAAAATSTASSAAGVGSGKVAQYAGSLVSSLQTLIQQVGSSGATGGAANLSASFSNLTAGTVDSTPAANAALQNFLGRVLQDVQCGDGHAMSRLGALVNASV
jgi:hypothetical protein